MATKQKNILILTYWSYQDALIQTYTLPYVRIIRKIIPQKNKLFLVTFDSDNHQTDGKEEEKIKKELLNEGIRWIRFRYFPLSIKAILFTLFAVIKLLLLCIFQKTNFIHAWCTPAGILGYILSKTTGVPLIIDSYEPHAEAMVENGTWRKNSMAFKFLFRFEALQSKYAKAVIATANGMEKYSKEKYGVVPKQFFVKPACVDIILFNRENFKSQKKISGLENKIVCVYAGKFGGIYLEKEVFDFFKTASDYWRDDFVVLLLTNMKRGNMDLLARQSGLNPDIIISKFVSHKDVPEYLSMADFAINPVKPIPAKRYCTSIKDGEYWAMGLPVVITRNISNDSDIIEKNNIGAVIDTLDVPGYLSAIKKIDSLLKNNSGTEFADKVREVAKQYRNFSIAEGIYNRLYG